MSIKELKLAQNSLNSLRVNCVGNHVAFTSENTANKTMCVMLDRNQAHLLYLYLQEHLGYNKFPTIPKEMWLCGCGKHHSEGFVCTMLK